MAEPRLVVTGVRKAFRTGRQSLPVLDRIDLTVARGEFVALVGPSGCGKSTLFDVLAGLVRADEGTVRVDGQLSTGQRNLFGYLPQQDLLFPWRTVLDNTALGLEVGGVRRRAARELAAALFPTFGLAGFETARPFELSGGMRQRAALLRTVVQRRSVLLLDEPFAALDSLTRTDMQLWLEGVRAESGWTVLLITHDIREAVFLADRVLVLGPRPTRVLDEIAVPLPRPRDLTIMESAEFTRLESQVLRAVRGPGRSPGECAVEK